jgi:hypothetical protein
LVELGALAGGAEGFVVEGDHGDCFTESHRFTRLVKLGFTDPALRCIKMLEGFKARKLRAGFLECFINTQDSVVRHGGEPPLLDLKYMELLVLFKIIRQGVAHEVNREQVAGRKAIMVSFNLPHVEKLRVASFPDAKLMHGKGRGKRVPGLDQLRVWQRARLPAERLDRQAEHGSSNVRLVEPDLELEARRFLAANPQDVRLEKLPLPPFVVLGELFSDKAADDLWRVG